MHDAVALEHLMAASYDTNHGNLLGWVDVRVTLSMLWEAHACTPGQVGAACQCVDLIVRGGAQVLQQRLQEYTGR